MAGHDILVVGASTGGVETLQTCMSGLPPDLPVAPFVALHIPPDSRSALPTTSPGPLPAEHALDGEAIRQRHLQKLQQVVYRADLVRQAARGHGQLDAASHRPELNLAQQG